MYDQANRVWVLVLNAYQRDNLLWLLNVIGYPVGESDEWVSKHGIHNDKEVKPFHLANTGDWVGEIAIALGAFEPEPFEATDMSTRRTRKPNMTAHSLEQDVKHWLDITRKNPA